MAEGIEVRIVISSGMLPTIFNVDLMLAAVVLGRFVIGFYDSPGARLWARIPAES